MVKRILLALALTASLGGAVVACNTPAATTSPSSVTTPSTGTDSSPAASDMTGSPAASDATMSAEPTAS
jgi:hypothetical protein